MNECLDIIHDITLFLHYLELKDEIAAGYHLNRLLLWSENGEWEIEKYSWITKIGGNNRKKPTPFIFVWYVFDTLMKEDDYYQSCFTSLYRYDLGSPRLIFFSLVLYWCRQDNIHISTEEYKYQDLYKGFTWISEMFKDKEFTDEEHVLKLRSFHTINPVSIDKHTRSGKGQDTLKFLNKVLEEYDIDWFTEEEKERSHRRHPPKGQGSSKFFHEVASMVAIESKIDNPYKKISYDMYLSADKQLGVKKAKSREIGKAYWKKYMKGYGECKAEAEEEEEIKKEKKIIKLNKVNKDSKKEIEPLYSLSDVSIAPTGQKRTSRAKKYLYIPTKDVGNKCALVFKGIYDSKKEIDKVLTTIGRGYIMNVGDTNILLPLGIKDAESTGDEYYIDWNSDLKSILKYMTKSIRGVSKFYVIYLSMAYTDPSTWEIEEYRDSFGEDVLLVKRDQLGLSSIHELLDEHKSKKDSKKEVFKFMSHAFPMLFKTYLYAFLLGIGDMQLGNTLLIKSNNRVWKVIVYEDNSGRIIQNTTIDDLLFRKKPSQENVKIFRCCFKVFKDVVLNVVDNINPEFDKLARANIADYDERLNIAREVIYNFYE